MIQQNKLDTTTSRAICGVNRKDYYFYASRSDLMLEIGFFSSLYAEFHLFSKTLWAEDYAAETFHILNLKSNNDYVVILFKQVFHIILVFLDALRTPNYSLDEILIKSCKTQTGLLKHHF